MTPQAKSIVIAAVVVLAVAIGAFAYFSRPVSAPGPDAGIIPGNTPAATSTPASTSSPSAATGSPAPSGSRTPTPSASPKPAAGGITMTQVAAHSTAASCWTAIRGSVYDLTSWISKHPGGQQAILQLCGKDGTTAFVNQHGGSPQQESILATFKIGILAQ